MGILRSASSYLSGPSGPAGIGTFPLVRTREIGSPSNRFPDGCGVVAGLHRASPSASLDKKTPIEFSVMIRQFKGRCQPGKGKVALSPYVESTGYRITSPLCSPEGFDPREVPEDVPTSSIPRGWEKHRSSPASHCDRYSLYGGSGLQKGTPAEV